MNNNIQVGTKGTAFLDPDLPHTLSEFAPLRNMKDNIQMWEPKTYFKKELKAWKCFSVIITGSSRAGKSYMLKHILTMDNGYLLKKFDFVIVFSKTLINGFYEQFIKSKLLFEDYIPMVIDHMKQEYIKRKNEGKPFKWLVIMDDCVDGKSKYLQHIQDLYFHGRHYEASVMFLTQKCSLMATGWMANTSVVISLFAGSRAEKEYLAEKIISDAIDEYCGDMKLRDVNRLAVLLHSTICKDYNALIILPYELDKKIYRYRA